MKNDFTDFNFWCLEGLSSIEIRSLVKSNVIPHKIRRLILFKANQESIKELLPIIAIVAVGQIIHNAIVRFE